MAQAKHREGFRSYPMPRTLRVWHLAELDWPLHLQVWTLQILSIYCCKN